MRTAIVVAVACLSAVGLCAGQEVQASIKKSTNIPAQELVLALKTLAHERGFHVVFHSEVVGAKRTHGAVGDLTTMEALTKLLEGTNLTYSYLDEKTVTILPVNSNNKAGGEGPPAGNSQRCSGISSNKLDYVTLPKQTGSERASDCVDRYSQGNELLAAAIAGVEEEPVHYNDGESSKESTPKVELEEVIVTAQKRIERAQDVPIAMTVLNPDELAQNGQNRLIDYFSSVPGLNLSSNAAFGGTSYVTIRGLSTTFGGNPSVATLVDDVPVGSTQSLGDGNLVLPDLDPSDLARIEVLKGPQGTLYGADSLGGLLKYVTTDPSTSRLSGRAEVTGVDIPEGGAGYAVRAAANIPVSDTFAIRASGFFRHDPGYIDNVTTGANNFNSADVYGGHFSALYRPSERLSLKLSALIQNTDGNGNAFVISDNTGHIPPGALTYAGLRGTERWYTRWELYSATLNAKVANIDVTSVTGYNHNTLFNWEDLSGLPFFSDIANQHFPGSSGAPQASHFYTEKLSQELRLSSALTKWLEWLIGGFYTHETSPNTMQQLFAANISTGALTGLLETAQLYPLTLSEEAVFADLTFHLTKRFDLQVGGRQAWNRILYESQFYGPAVPDILQQPSPFVQPTGRGNGSPFTYLVTPQLKISPDLQLYARIATGYRVGGPNIITTQSIPAGYKPDKSTNYEIGIKGDLFERRLTFDAALYYINWKDLQINVGYGNSSFITNAGTAKSEGMELQAEAHPIEGLTLGVQGSLNNAVLTQDLPAAALLVGSYGLAGDRLPYSTRVSGGFTINQDVHLTGNWVGFAGGALNYVGPRPSEFPFAPPPAERVWMPGYAQLNLRTGVRNEFWLVNLYVNNAAGRRGVVSYLNYPFILGYPAADFATVTQPRTVGLNVARTF